MSSLANAIVVGDSSDDEGPKPPPAVPAWARAKAPPPPPSRAKAPPKAKAPPPPAWARAKAPPPPPSARAKAPQCLPPARKKLCGPDRQAVAASAPSPDERMIAEVSGVDDQPTIAPAPRPAKKPRPYKCRTCGELKKTGCKCFAASIISSTTQYCTDPKCTDGSCLRLHQCDGRWKGRGCQGLWLASRAFDFKKGGDKRNRRCRECMARCRAGNAISNPTNNPINNPINNAKTSKKKMQERIAYEKATLNDEHDLTPEGLKAHREAAISRAEELCADYNVTYPEGYAVIFYGASTGSDGYTVVEEGVNQLRPRGQQKTPSIIETSGDAPSVTLTKAWGPGGVSVYNCGSSKAISRAVETALHEHFWPICDASDGKMLRLWRRCGAGAPQGIGPYHVCIRIMPLPMPHGWRRGF